MSSLLKNVTDIQALMKAVEKCKSDVFLKSCDGKETFNLKSTLSAYIGIGRLCEEQGDQWEIYTNNREDEAYLLQFFYEIKS